MAETLDAATGKFLMNRKSPSRKVQELDNRGSHFYLTLYWAEALAAQTQDAELRAAFTQAAKDLEANEAKIMEELNAAQGKSVSIGGYYAPDEKLASGQMRPSATFNKIVASIG